jgi:hypothetical protein
LQYSTLLSLGGLSKGGRRVTQFLKPQEIFRSYPEIRWAALINDKGEVRFSVMRQGVESLVPENDITGFMEANRGKSILKASQGLAQWAGKVEGALIRYEKVFLYMIQLQTEVLVLSIDRATTFERIAQIAKSLLSDLQLE